MSNEDFENFKNIICPIFHQCNGCPLEFFDLSCSSPTNEGKRILEEWKKKITDKNFLDSFKK